MRDGGFDPVELARWCGGVWRPAAPAFVSAIGHDTRALAPGSLYVALRGGRHDGHAFVAEAFRLGAAGALVEDAAAASLAQHGPVLAVPDTLTALRALAAGHRRRLRAVIIGVSGSVGKTTVKELIAHLLAAAMPVACTQGNWNNEIGLPLSLLAMPVTARAGVFEMGISHPGEMRPLCETLQPDWGVLTHVGPAHLEFFPSMEAIAREKAVLLSGLPAAGAAFLCRDQEWFELLRSLASAPVVTVSAEDAADFRCVLWRAAEGRMRVREAAGGAETELPVPLPGRHQISNTLLAVAVARRMGVDWSAIKEALAHYTGPAMRWEVTRVGGVTLINDAYNANPLSMRAALETFASVRDAARKWLVLGDMLELGSAERKEHERVGRSVGAGDWAGLIAVGSRSRWLADEAERTAEGRFKVIRRANGREAAEQLAAIIAPGDAVLFKASRGARLEEAVARLRELLATKKE